MKTIPRARLLVLLPLLGAPACDNGGVGVIELVQRTDLDGEVVSMPSCVLVERAGGSSAGGGGSGENFASEMFSHGGTVGYRYYISKEGEHHMFLSPSTGELAAEIDADMEFFESGDTKHVSFESYDGVAYDVYLWGEPDCEGDLPFEPPAP